MNYYNEFDPKAAAWLRSLIDAELIPPGHVDDRSIADVTKTDLDGFTQCHFFCGISGWPLALRLANWPADRPVWTGSCPCQPFSSAGKGKGVNDERHLWPEFARLIGECKPPTVFGEQVASKAGRGWLDGVFADLEDLDYRCGAADLCAASAGAPHIRQRLFWVADSEGDGRGHDPRDSRTENHPRAEDRSSGENAAGIPRKLSGGSELPSGLGDNLDTRPQGHAGHVGNRDQPGRIDTPANGSARPTSWDRFDIIRCVEPTKEPGRYVEKRRRVESGLCVLAHGIPGRVAQLRGLGNAIVPQVAAEFIMATQEAMGAA